MAQNGLLEPLSHPLSNSNSSLELFSIPPAPRFACRVAVWLTGERSEELSRSESRKSPRLAASYSLLITLHRFVRVAAGVVGSLGSVVGYDDSR